MLNDYLTGGITMKGYIKGTAVVFGNFSNFKANSDNMYELLDSLRGYGVIPSIAKEVILKVENNIPNQIVIDRLRFDSKTKRFSVVIFEDKIIIESKIEYNEKESNITFDINAFESIVKEVYSILIEYLKVNATRLSLVIAFISDENVEEKLEKNIVVNENFKGKNIFEWNVKSVLRETIEKLNNEEININYSVYKSKGNVNVELPEVRTYELDGIVEELDINTLFENALDRIDINYIKEFYTEAFSRVTNIIQ